MDLHYCFQIYLSDTYIQYVSIWSHSEKCVSSDVSWAPFSSLPNKSHHYCSDRKENSNLPTNPVCRIYCNFQLSVSPLILQGKSHIPKWWHHPWMHFEQIFWGNSGAGLSWKSPPIHYYAIVLLPICWIKMMYNQGICSLSVVVKPYLLGFPVMFLMSNIIIWLRDYFNCPITLSASCGVQDGSDQSRICLLYKVNPDITFDKVCLLWILLTVGVLCKK